LYQFFINNTLKTVSNSLICHFSINPKILPEDNLETSKHVGVL